MCAEALKLHGSVCTTAMRGLHEFMEVKYREFRKNYGNVDDVRQLFTTPSVKPVSNMTLQ